MFGRFGPGFRLGLWLDLLDQIVLEDVAAAAIIGSVVLVVVVVGVRVVGAVLAAFLVLDAFVLGTTHAGADGVAGLVDDGGVHVGVVLSGKAALDGGGKLLVHVVELHVAVHGELEDVVEVLLGEVVLVHGLEHVGHAVGAVLRQRG